MPSLNCKTRKLTYTAADSRTLASALTLLDAMREFDTDAVGQPATNCALLVRQLSQHVSKERNGKAEK